MPVNHVIAHLYANVLDGAPLVFPCVGLVISGGHTSLYYGEGVTEWSLMGETIDDAAGEAFDKVAIMLGLGYPGGRKIEELARKGQGRALSFPRSLLGKDSLDFSFSGLKTAVLYHVYGHGARGPCPEGSVPDDAADVAASFQEAVCDTVAEKIRRAVEQKGVAAVCAGGGVVCNGRLRERITDVCGSAVRLRFPPRALCTDNAAMTAGIGYHLFQAGVTADTNLEVIST